LLPLALSGSTPACPTALVASYIGRLSAIAVCVEVNTTCSKHSHTHNITRLPSLASGRKKQTAVRGCSYFWLHMCQRSLCARVNDGRMTDGAQLLLNQFTYLFQGGIPPSKVLMSFLNS